MDTGAANGSDKAADDVGCAAHAEEEAPKQQVGHVGAQKTQDLHSGHVEYNTKQSLLQA
jgi:hypothetical protein